VNIQSLYIYPVKSTRGQRLSEATVRSRGFAHDRRWMVIDANGGAITGRDVAQLSLVSAQTTDRGLALSRSGVDPLDVETPGANSKRAFATVWGDRVDATDAGDAASLWLTRALSIPCRLVYMDNAASRSVVDSSHEVSFADAWPILVTTTASSEDLNSRVEQPLDIRRFRPNIIIDGAHAFEEDSWRLIRIGDVELEISGPCERCSFTTLDPDSADGHPRQEPLRTLATYRRSPDGEVCFGQNAAARSFGVIREGDPVEIIETGAPRPTLAAS